MYKVLLVDDEILVRDAIRENIDWNSLGFMLVGDCQNGKEAKTFVDEHEVDVVLTDICMPFMDGMELSEYLFHNYPEISIIIFSGFEEFEYAKKAIQYKVSEYILKPVTAMELSGVLTGLHNKLEQQKNQESKINELKKGFKTYKKNVSYIRSKMLSCLVMGTQKTTTVLAELAEIGITLETSSYRIVSVEMDVYSELYEVDETLKKESALMAFAVENISNEIIHNYNMGLAFQTTDNRVYLLIQTNKPKESMSIIRKMCEEIQSCIYNAMKLSVSCGMGIYVKNVEDIHLSYDSSMEALGYRYVLGDGTILDMELERAKLDREVDITEELDFLSKVIKTSDHVMVDRKFEEIFNLIKGNIVGKGRACFYLQQIIGQISDTLTEIDGNAALHTEKRNELSNQIVQVKTYKEAHEKVRAYTHEAVELISTMNRSSGSKIALSAMDYIKKNYNDPDLSLNDICSYLSISTSHFSTVFKEEIGATFMEVLIRIRMEKAKELLAQTTLKNYEIAERVGFGDPHYFSIAFKKMTGKSPTEYAKEMR